MKTLSEINKEYQTNVSNNWQEHAKSALKEIEYMGSSTAKYHGRCVSTLYIPKMFREKDMEVFNQLIIELYGIFDKVIEEYMNNPEYRKLFGFEEQMEELILKKPLYETKIPMARIDIFYHEEDSSFKFCEFNTDGSSAMNEDRELNHALVLTAGYKALEKNYEISTCELFDSWVNESMDIYHSILGAKEKPYVVIADFMESATNNEFEIFAQRYRQQNIPCEVCEIRDLTYKDGVLYSTKGNPIDVIYRRAVTSDIFSHYDQVQDFIRAVKEDAVCLLGDFRTQIVHNKILYKILYLEETHAFLTEKEIAYIHAHVPYTASLNNHSISEKELVEEKDKWILKPEDSYGSKGVYAGVEYDDPLEWKKIIERLNGSEGYILQEFATPYTTLNVDFSRGQDTEFLPVYNLTGLFVYGGSFRGMYSRVSRGKIISTQYSEIALPSIVLKEK